jgi:hypothetical protein
MKEFAARGWEADVGFIRPDETAGPTVERLLGSKRYDCVVIGGPTGSISENWGDAIRAFLAATQSINLFC